MSMPVPARCVRLASKLLPQGPRFQPTRGDPAPAIRRSIRWHWRALNLVVPRCVRGDDARQRRVQLSGCDRSAPAPVDSLGMGASAGGARKTLRATGTKRPPHRRDTLQSVAIVAARLAQKQLFHIVIASSTDFAWRYQSSHNDRKKIFGGTTCGVSTDHTTTERRTWETGTYFEH